MKKSKKTKKTSNINSKNLIINTIIIVLNLVLIIYVAKQNTANYANVNGEKVFVGNTKNLLFGRNYITLIITIFTNIYYLVMNKLILKNKFNKKQLILIFIGILLFNMLTFYIFTKKVY